MVRLLIATIFVIAASTFLPEKKLFSAEKELKKLLSVSSYITFGDFEKFKKGTSLSEIMDAMSWRGHFRSTLRYNESTITTIYFNLLADGQKPAECDTTLVAVFVGDKFEKFVEWIGEEPLRVDDCSWEKKVIAADAVTLDQLKSKKKIQPNNTKQVDVGLTITWLILSKAIPSATQKDYEANSELRDQFNGARIKLGMSQEEVKKIFKASPIESGKLGSDEYAIYGSDKRFIIADAWIHFSNILVIYRDGKAEVVRSAPNGDNWREELSRVTIDLPLPAKK
jgi:hypothetical protein